MATKCHMPDIPWLTMPTFLEGIAAMSGIVTTVDHIIRPVSAWDALARDFDVVARDFRVAFDAVVAEAQGEQESLFSPDRASGRD